MSIEDDARAVGQHFAGGWSLGLLVARNVRKRAGAGRTPKSEQVRNKVSCAQFAKMAGVSERNVQFIYDTWQLAAEEGHCTPADQLVPGAEDPLLPQERTDEHHEMWRKFYRQIRERRPQSGSARAGSRGRKSETSQSNSQEGQSDTAARDKPFPTPEDHALYGLMIAVNNLADELKRRGPTPLILQAAAKVASKEHRAALRRATGAL